MGDVPVSAKLKIDKYFPTNNHLGDVRAGDVVVVHINGHEEAMLFEELNTYSGTVAKTELPNGDVYVDANGNGLMDKGDWVAVNEDNRPSVFTVAAYLVFTDFTKIGWKRGKPGSFKNLQDYLEAKCFARERWPADNFHIRNLYIKEKAGTITPAEKAKLELLLHPEAEEDTRCKDCSSF